MEVLMWACTSQNQARRPVITAHASITGGLHGSRKVEPCPRAVLKDLEGTNGYLVHQGLCLQQLW